MILDIYLMLIAMGFILFIIGVERWSIVYSGTSFLMWIIVFAASFYIEVPGIDEYTDYTVNALCLAFIFINVIIMLMIHFKIGEPKYPLGPHR